MISIDQVSIDDSTGFVTLTAHTDSSSLTFYRKIGLTDETSISGTLTPDAQGRVVWQDTAAPQKTLLAYTAVSGTYERSLPAQAVLPSTYSLSRPTLGGDIRLGDMIFNTIDTDGTVWTVTDIDGWWNLPEASVPVADKSKYDDGSWDEDGRYLARTLTFSGQFLPSDSGFLESARERLIKAFDTVRGPVYLRVDQSPPRQMTVRISGKTSIVTQNPAGLSTFTVQLLAADPIKYSLDQQSVSLVAGISQPGRTYPRVGNRHYGTPVAPATGLLTNLGDASTPPVIQIWGPTANPQIQLLNTGEFMKFTATLTAGQYLLVDVSQKSVLFNGAVSLRGAMSVDSSWFRIVPGINYLQFVQQSVSSIPSQAVIAINSAWIG